MFNKNLTAEEIIKKLNLEPLPLEGGFFNETYRSSTMSSKLEKRCCGTCIYYLLKNSGISDWHKVTSDEIWLYHGGSPASQVLLFPDGSWEERILGIDIAQGNVSHSIIPANTWQATVPIKNMDGFEWSLFSAVVVPGFEFEDYTHGKREELMTKWPEAKKRCQELGLA